MDSATYQHILGTTLKDSVDYYGINWSSWYFQQDNDPKHKSKSTLKWLQDNRVNVISDWPAQSPDLNPMEHIWRQLKLNLSLYKTHAKNTQELWERIEKEWNKFDKDLCCKYIDTMPDRIRALKAMDVQRKKVRAAVTLVACDLPAARKLCGFTSPSSNCACHKCQNQFGSLMTDRHRRNFTNFDVSTWIPRTLENHRRNALLWKRAPTVHYGASRPAKISEFMTHI
ncbi:hypothetical protein G6F71_009386 [Rhizopus microsporus]|nr:hypothetical protein G6F71_009386 [Rhizopus microsporus]